MAKKAPASALEVICLTEKAPASALEVIRSTKKAPVVTLFSPWVIAKSGSHDAYFASDDAFFVNVDAQSVGVDAFWEWKQSGKRGR